MNDEEIRIKSSDMNRDRFNENQTKFVEKIPRTERYRMWTQRLCICDTCNVKW